MRKTALVVSAQAADFVWLTGGAIAVHAETGYDATIGSLSIVERSRDVDDGRECVEAKGPKDL